MRFIPLCLAALLLTGCAFDGTVDATKPVDLTTLSPLTGREQALMVGADGALQQGNYAAAERDYLNAVGASSGHVEAHLALARLYEKQQQPEKEMMILGKALALQPHHAAANYRMGKLHLNGNHYTQALANFQHGRADSPRDIDLAVGEAITNDMLGNHLAAQHIYQRIMTENPKAQLTSLRTNLGMSYLLGGEPKRAVELLKIALKNPNASQVTRHNLALAYGVLGRHGEAKTLLGDDMDEATRLLTVARMKEYVAQQQRGGTPTITPAQAMSPVAPAAQR